MPNDPAAALLQYGAVGAMLCIVAVFAWRLIQREQHRSDRLDAEVTRLNGVIQEKVIPALVTANQTIADAQQLLQTLQYQRDVERQAVKNDGASLAAAAMELRQAAVDVRGALERGKQR